VTRSSALTCCLAVGVLVLAAATAGAVEPGPRGTIVRPAAPVAEEASAPPLRLVSASKKVPRLTELEFSTPYLSTTTRVRVLTPVGYDKAPRKRWPLLLLLHGTSETPPGEKGTGYARWTDEGNAEVITRPGRFLVVMPEAKAGLYTDHYGVAGQGGPAWESYHLRQLLPWVDAHFRTIPDRAHRAVAGLSMGGGGAMKYAARHPDVFSFAQGFSGAVDPTDGDDLVVIRSTDIDQALLVTNGDPPESAFGPWLTEEVRTRAHGPVDLVGNLRQTALTLRVGDGTDESGVITDPLEWAVHGQNVNLHRALVRAGVAHTYDDYPGGEHTFAYFSRDLTLLVAPLNAHFASGAGRTPARFSFTWAEERADVHDYRIASDRGFLEFATLDVAPGGFTISGSGVFTVTTPAMYDPGRAYRVTARRNGRTEHLVAKADRSGHLSLAVDTGRRSTGQQYRSTSRTSVNQVQVTLHRV
jgi:S-formylglutathione hydrolase FrmB